MSISKNLGWSYISTAQSLRESARHFDINSHKDPLRQKISELLFAEADKLLSLSLHYLRDVPSDALPPQE